MRGELSWKEAIECNTEEEKINNTKNDWKGIKETWLYEYLIIYVLHTYIILI